MEEPGGGNRPPLALKPSGAGVKVGLKLMNPLAKSSSSLYSLYIYQWWAVLVG